MNWGPWTVVLEKTLESPLKNEEIKPVNLEGNQPWILIGRTDAEAEAPVFWSPDMNSRLTGKVPDAGKDWGQKDKMVSDDEVAGWHHWNNGHELGQTLGDGEGPAVLQSMGLKELDMTGQLNNMVKTLCIFLKAGKHSHMKRKETYFFFLASLLELYSF